jgi:hypothetical protein
MNQVLYLNPEFKELRPYFEMYRDLFIGDQATLKSPDYLWPHEIEKTPAGAVVRKIREQRSSYTNHIETLVSQWTSLLFKSDPIIPPEVSDLLGDSIENIDGKGTSLISFLRNSLVPNSLVFGRPILYVGAYGTKPENLKQEMSGTDFRPYFEAIHPLDFKDYQEETEDPKRLGQLNFVRLEYVEAVPRMSANEAPYIRRISKQYRVTPEGLEITRYQQAKVDPLTQTQKTLVDQSIYADGTEWEQTGQVILSDWDEIPIVADLHGTSWIKDIAPHVLKFYNCESVLDNIILFQAYQRVIFSGDLEQKDAKTLAENTIGIVPAGTTVHTIEPTNLAGIHERLGTILNNIYRLGLNQVRMMSADSAAAQSDQTIKEEKQNVAALVKSEMEGIETLVNHGVRLFAKYKGIDDFESEIKFNTDVNTSDVNKFVQLVLAFKDDVAKYPSIKKAQLVKYVKELDLPNEEELLADIEASEDEQQPQPPDLRSLFLGGITAPEPDEPEAGEDEQEDTTE